MRTLALFVALCLALAGVVAWLMFPESSTTKTRETVPFTRAPAVSRPSVSSHPEAGVKPQVQPQLLEESPARTISPATRPVAVDAPQKLSSAPVHWVGEESNVEIARRFRELREIIAEDSHNELAIIAALELARERQWPNEVCDLLTRLFRLRPDDASIRFELATQLMLLERWVEAIPHLRELSEQHPDDARVLHNLAVSHQAVGALHDARRSWDRVIELTPDNPEALARRGEVLLDLRKWDAAAEDSRRVLDLAPESLDAAMNLSLALSKIGEIAEARKLLATFLPKNPRHVPLLNRLAELTWMAYESGSTPDAALARETRSYCERSLAIVPNQSDVRELLVRAADDED